jgi:hypothetical protein
VRGTFALDLGKLLGLLGISGRMSLHRRSKDLGQQARFDLETAEDVLAPQIKKIASYEAS